MKLTYRGTEYIYDGPTNEPVDPLALDIRFRNMKKAPEYTPTLSLKYHELAADESNEASTALGNLARTLMSKRSCSVKRRQQDMLSRLVFEAGVPAEEVERDWNKIQGMIQSTFRADYGRSGAAMS